MRTSHHTERHSSSSSCTISKSENCTRLLSLLSHKFTWSNLLNIWQMWLLFPSTLDIALLQDLFNWLIFLLLAKPHISIPHSNKWPSVMYQSDLSKWPIFIWKVLFLYLNRSHCLQDKTLIPWHCIVSSLIIYSLLSLQRSHPILNITYMFQITWSTTRNLPNCHGFSCLLASGVLYPMLHHSHSFTWTIFTQFYMSVPPGFLQIDVCTPVQTMCSLNKYHKA